MPVIKNMMVRAGADFSSFVTQSKRASQSVKGLKTDVSSSFMGIKSAASGIKSVLGAIGVGVSVYSIVSSARDAAEAYDEQSEAETKLATAMRNSMSARNSEIQSVLNLCSAQQKLGVIGDELQLAGAQKLATYVSEINSLKELIPAMNDMTAQQYGYKASAENSASAAAALGKAMIGQTTALKRYGYTFTEDEAAIMNYGTEAERAATLAQVVERKVGGMNRSLAQTPTGRMQQLTNTLGDIRENAGACVRAIGTLFLPVLWKVADGLATITTWAQRAVNSVGTVFGYSKLVSGWEDATTSITDYGDEWDDTTDAIKEAGKAAEDTKGKLMGFDELNILNGDSAASAIADIVNAGNVGSTIPATSTAIPAVQDILGENRDIPWLTKLMLPVKDVLFDWHDLKPEQIAQKAVSGLGMLLGGAVGFMIGGVPGALVGTLAGLALTLVANSVIFDHDGVVSQSELMSMIVTGLNGLVGGAIGFAIGGVPGALIGATIGVGITLLAESIKPLLNVDGQEVMSGIVSGLTYGIGSAVGGLIGFTLGGPAGAVVGMLVGLGITFAITNTLAKHGNGSGGRGILSSIVDGLNMALAGGIGGIVGFAVGGPAGAAIGLLVGLGINFAITTSNAKHGSGRGGRSIMSSIVSGLNTGLAGTAGGLIGFAIGGPAGAAIGLTVGLGLHFVLTNWESLKRDAVTWGGDFVKGITKGMRDMLSSVGDAATAIGSRIRSILHFSTPDEGPLRDYESWMPDFMSGLAVGIRSNRGLVRREAAGAADDIAAALYSSVDPSLAFPRGYSTPSTAQRSSGSEGPTYILGAFGAALERVSSANSASNRPITTIFKVGEKEWARATYDPLNAVKREKGFSLISNFN